MLNCTVRIAVNLLNKLKWLSRLVGPQDETYVLGSHQENFSMLVERKSPPRVEMLVLFSPRRRLRAPSHIRKDLEQWSAVLYCAGKRKWVLFFLRTTSITPSCHGAIRSIVHTVPDCRDLREKVDLRRLSFVMYCTVQYSTVLEYGIEMVNVQYRIMQRACSSCTVTKIFRFRGYQYLGGRLIDPGVASTLI